MRRTHVLPTYHPLYTELEALTRDNQSAGSCASIWMST